MDYSYSPVYRHKKIFCGNFRMGQLVLILIFMIFFIALKQNPPGLNFINYCNPKLDKLLEEGRYTLDREKRKKIYYQIQEILAEDQPYTFFIHSYEFGSYS